MLEILKKHMKLFIDTAVIEEIRQAASFIDGVTTNPTLIAKSGRRVEDAIKEICKIVDGPISAEVISEDSEGMTKEAKSLAKIHKNIVVKIPMTIEGIKAVKQLAREKIKTNVTLVFSVNQALIAAKAGASYVSPFVGRLDDIGQDGMKLVEEIMQIYKNYNFKTEVIVASVRHPIHVKQAAMIGANIATVPFSVLKQLFEHSLTTAGIKRFLEDNKRIKK